MKVAVIGFSFFDYTKHICKALERIGHEIIFYIPNDTEEKSNFREFNIFKKKLLDFEPDVFINFCGNYRHKYIDETVLNSLKAYKINIFVDSIKSLKYAENDITKYDKVYLFESNDLKYVKNKYNINCSLFEVCVDTDVFYNGIKRTDRYLDISFVGNLTEERRLFFNDICKFAIDKLYVIKIYNKVFVSKHWWKNIIERYKFKKKYPYLYLCLENKNLSFEQCADLYSHTKICLNKHIDKHQGMGYRNFEIMAGNNFCMSDVRKQCNDYGLVDGDNISLYKNIEECKLKIKYYLENSHEREDIALVGGSYVRSNYSVDIIVKKILDEYNVSCKGSSCCQ